MIALVTSLMLSCPAVTAQDPSSTDEPRPPNIVFVLADDLGYGELGCYGQPRIRTPHLDRLAEQGVRMTQHYSGHCVCAPSRAVLLTGRHTGRSWIRGNSPWASARNPQGEGQEPLPEGTPNLARMLREHGYATACVGKWGLGGPGSSGAPLRQGFDHFFGHLCQKQAHDHYPDHLWRDGARVPLRNPGFTPAARWSEAPAGPEAYRAFSGEDYVGDRMLDDALAFVRTHAERPFFLYYATPVPHAALQVPADSLAAYLPEGWDEAPYLGEKGYLPHPAPRAAYAAMVSRLDRDVGRLLDELDALGLGEDTLVIFSSDNGPTFNGGTDSEFFASTAGLRGRKGSLYEGGIRVPFLARWPGRLPAAAVCDVPAGFQDFWPTLCEILGTPPPADLDGSSYLPALQGRPAGPRRPLYWEAGRSQALRDGDLKLVRRVDAEGGVREELFDLRADPAETLDLAARRPDDLARLRGMAAAARIPSALFASPFDPED